MGLILRLESPSKPGVKCQSKGFTCGCFCDLYSTKGCYSHHVCLHFKVRSGRSCAGSQRDFFLWSRQKGFCIHQWTPGRNWSLFSYRFYCQLLQYLFFPHTRFQQNTAMGCCFAPVQREIRQPAQNAADKQSYPSAPMRIKTHLIVCLFRTHARPTTSAGRRPRTGVFSPQCAAWYSSQSQKTHRKRVVTSVVLCDNNFVSSYALIK